MDEKRLKYIFLAASAFLLIVMLLASRNAAVSCDDVLHYNQSERVYNYFASHGRDRSALETPVNNLKFYGQSYDNIVTVLIRWFRIGDVFSFRHLMSAFAGWLAIFLSGLFAARMSGYRTSVLVLLLASVSPTFMGHSLNNLKDIPFALGYIASLFFMFRIFFDPGQFRFTSILLLIISLAFTISIRAGGLILPCYLFLFFGICSFIEFNRNRSIHIQRLIKKLAILILASLTSLFLSILLWPFALQAPVRNMLASLNFMTHFPGTFREIFEGSAQWTDMMPWRYLPEYMAITIPLVVLAGILLFFIFARKTALNKKLTEWIFLLFTIVFPVLYAIVKRSNIYSGWRQFLFLYPPLLIIAASGFNVLFEHSGKRYIRWAVMAALFVLSIHPVKFMAENKAYWYIYFNQFTGGLKGAYGNFETDYYYTGQTEAARWLADYLMKNNIDTARVAATFPVDWQFRKMKGVRTSCIRYEERSQEEWDYSIICNRYIPPVMLKKHTWPPENTIHTVFAGGIPVCAVLKRMTDLDYSGYKALEEGKNQEALDTLNRALRINSSDEMIFFNFARALCNDGKYEKADSVLKHGLKINPVSEQVLMYLGNISFFRKDSSSAKNYYRQLLGLNRKYFEAYVALARIEMGSSVTEARKTLLSCLDINPGFRPAVKMLADTYRKTDPAMASKYDRMLESLK